MKPFTVAIDGPVAAGKGTIARAVADRFGFAYLDTGLLYRAVAKILLDRELTDNEAAAEAVARMLRPEDLDQAGLRTPAVSSESSRVASFPGVRSALMGHQRQFARRNRGAVLDGRDIGTVICPEADVKIYVTASDSVRAKRRHEELARSGIEVSEAEVLSELQQRDKRDSTRNLAALRISDDAILLDTSELSIEQAVQQAISTVEKRSSST